MGSANGGYDPGAQNAQNAAFGGTSPGLQAKNGLPPGMPGGTPGPQGVGGVLGQPGFNGNPFGPGNGIQGGQMGLQNGFQGGGQMGLQNGQTNIPPWGQFSYSPNAGPLQQRPDWSHGGWMQPPPGATPPPTGAPPPNQYPGGWLYPPSPGGIYNVGPNPGNGINPPPGGPPGGPPAGNPPPPTGGLPPPGAVQKSLTPAPGSQDALMQAVLTGQGGGNFANSQINQYGPPAGGGANWAQTLDYYKQNQAALNRQGPAYQPGGMFYGR